MDNKNTDNKVTVEKLPESQFNNFYTLDNMRHQEISRTPWKKCENNLKVEGSEIVKAIEDATKERLILEMEYILPSTPYRIKSVYFPTDTKLTLKGKELWNKQL